MERRDGERRRSGSRMHRPERRTGFDRRLVGVWDRFLLRYGKSEIALAAVLLAVNLLNALDYVLTLRALGQGATEANLLLASLFARDPLLAGILKVLAIGLVSVAIWSMRRYKAILEMSLVVAAIFVALIAYHVLGSLFLV